LNGVWNQNATKSAIARRRKELARMKIASPKIERMWQAQFEINTLLSRERKVVGRMLSDAFNAGAGIVLKELYDANINPFDKAYEGSPFHDFIGRLGGWPWPKARRRYD
jgi:hypothetical protein